MVSSPSGVPSVQFAVIDDYKDEVSRMFGRTAFVCFTILMLGAIGQARAQDVPGIEICTVEKTWERRTSCLQSNVDFLQKTITKLTTSHQQKLDAANRQIETLKATLVGLQKVISDLQVTQGKITDDLKKKADAPPAKDVTPATK